MRWSAELNEEFEFMLSVGTGTRFSPRSLTAEVISRVHRIEKAGTDPDGQNKWYSDWRYRLKWALGKLAEKYDNL
jgi:hypothetical protein